jgi:hypothetical protein
MSFGAYYGPLETWKVVYNPVGATGGRMGVALVEADCQHMAMHIFMEEYRGQYVTIEECKKLLG